MPRAHITTNRWQKDPLDAGTGYAASGESQYSRAVASGGKAEFPAHRIERSTPVEDKIRRTQIMIGTIEGKLKFERDPAKRAKLDKDLRIKNALLREYARERSDPNYRREKISV
jgi:hypothetical protein